MITPIPAKEKQMTEGEVHLFCPRGCRGARLGKRITRRRGEVRTLEGANGSLALEMLPEAGPLVTLTFLEPRYTNDPNPAYPEGWYWKEKESPRLRMRGRHAHHIYVEGMDYSHGQDRLVFQKQNYTPNQHQLEVARQHNTSGRFTADPGPTLGGHEGIAVCYKCGNPAIIPAHP